MRKVVQAGVLTGVVGLVVLATVVMGSDSNTGEQNDADFVAFERAQQAETRAVQQEPEHLENLPDDEPATEPTTEPATELIREPAGKVTGEPTAQHEAKDLAGEPGLEQANAAYKPQPPFGDETFREVPAEGDWKPSIPTEVIEDAIEAIKPAAQQCYDSLLQDFPDAEGTVRVRFMVQTEGGMARVQMSEIMENSTLFDSGLHDCLSQAVGSLTLPRAEGDAQVMVAYPFQFRADSPDDE